MDELRALFADFLAVSERCAVNLDDAEASLLIAHGRQVIGFGIDSAEARITVEPGSAALSATAVSARVIDRADGTAHELRLAMPGRHNLSNALAAVAGGVAAGIPAAEAVAALRSFTGVARRFSLIGTSSSGIAVIDDFGHNPEKVAATLRTLKAQSGRVIAFFQPHGYGPLKQMGHELALTFARELEAGDVALLCDPVYFGGTVDRSEGSQRIARLIEEAAGTKGVRAEYIPAREDCAARILEIARPGDRVAIMGARDDTLTGFAQDLFRTLP
jgi:UDP-N-acetylmuramate--alanine ligase